MQCAHPAYHFTDEGVLSGTYVGVGLFYRWLGWPSVVLITCYIHADAGHVDLARTGYRIRVCRDLLRPDLVERPGWCILGKSLGVGEHYSIVANLCPEQIREVQQC